MKKLFIYVVVGLFVIAAEPSFASEEESHESSHDAAPAKSGSEVATQCVACHGEDGNSPTPNFPRIAGQHADYMFHALMSYKNGDRKNPIMAGIVAALSEKEMKNVAAFYASQNGLSVVDIDDEDKH
ncbi:MAG: c-type cytochrome [Gammaproteobacteria bacterium]|nr:MAG: c-type cytochrome [Gammaproteobacteria bacterium]